jgi:hypothetical protein
MANQEMFDRVLQRISDDPDSLDMGAWYKVTNECSTTACLAGHTVLEAGYTPLIDPFVHHSGNRYSGVVEGGRGIPDLAQALLGLTFEQANAMFCQGAIESGDYREAYSPRTVEELSARWKAVTK